MKYAQLNAHFIHIDINLFHLFFLLTGNRAKFAPTKSKRPFDHGQHDAVPGKYNILYDQIPEHKLKEIRIHLGEYLRAIVGSIGLAAGGQ